MSKHTPGPWEPHLALTADGWWAYFVREGVEATAYDKRLIKAAPELLAELQNIANADTRTWDDPSDFKGWAQSRARAAIAKAEGAKP